MLLQFIITKILFGWHFDIPCNRFLITFNFHIRVQISQSCERISDINEILFFTLYLVSLLEIEYFCMKSV
jgi:hypothetical protein